jgi:organic radical activating enzyme
MKFTSLKVDFEQSTTYNCCSATPHKVDFNWLKLNPDQLFNIPINVSEREQMLNNERNNSCEKNCWAAEDLGASSPRLYQHAENKTHTDVHTIPEELDLMLGSDCNLTCSYCCREYSTAWRNDLLDNGSYAVTDDDGRFQIRPIDRVLKKISQKDKLLVDKSQILWESARLYLSDVKKVIISGGEPLSNNLLLTVLDDAKSVPSVYIYTGLGVSITRFQKMLTEFKKFPNLVLVISAENTNEFLEFNRYGIKWEEFIEKINLIRDLGIRFEFQSTLSNLSLFGYAKFYNYFKDCKITTGFVYTPNFMSPHVLDPNSKSKILDEIKHLPMDKQTEIMKSMAPDATSLQKQNIKEFLIEFTTRRKNLNLNIFPKSFLEWIDLDHVEE